MSSGAPTAVGVDLGTTYTCAAVADPGGTPRVVQLTGTSQTVPSVVSLLDDGEVVAGEAAERRLVTHPSATAREFKRRLGDATPVVLGSTAVTAEELSGHLLREVLDRVERNEGGRPDVVGLAHPASWGPFRLDLLRDAARHAGVGDVVLVPEPVAAAVANRDRVEAGSLVAVYDLGGGTFDAAVVRMDDTVTVVGTPEGVERLGGIDFDQAVMAHVDGVSGGQVFGLDRSDPDARGALMRLRSECQAAKEHLSQDSDVDIPVSLPGLQTTVRMTRAELESAVRPRLADSLAVFDRVVASAGVGWDDIGSVLLVGGSSNIPVVAQIVGEHTGRPVLTATSPHLAIAAGTAAVAAATVQLPTAAPTAPVTAAAVTDPAPASPAPADSGSKRPVALIGGLIAVALVAAVIALVVVGGGGGDDDADEAAESTAPAATEPDDGAADTTTPPDEGATETTTAPDDGDETDPDEPDAPDPGPVVVTACVDVADDTVGVLATDAGAVVVDSSGARLLVGVDATTCEFDPSAGEALALPVGGAPQSTAAFGALVTVATDQSAAIGSAETGQIRECGLIDGPHAVNGNGAVFVLRDGAVARIRTQGGDCEEQDSSQFADIDATAVGVAGNDRLGLGGIIDGAPAVRLFSDQDTSVDLGTDQLPGLAGVDALVRCGDDWCVVDLAGGAVHAVSVDGNPLGSSVVAGTPLDGAERVVAAVAGRDGVAILTVAGSGGAVSTVTLAG